MVTTRSHSAEDGITTDPVQQSAKQSNMPFNIEVALKMIPEFKGNKDQLDKFLTCCVIVFGTATTEADQSIFLNVVKTKLCDQAYNLIKYKTINHWAQLKVLLKDHYKERRTMAQIQMELNLSSRQKRCQNFCIFKIDKADDDFEIVTDRKIKLKGITNEYVESLGVCQAKISLGDTSVTHPFHIVPSNFPIPYDGVLGNDLLEQHGAVINFNESTLKFAAGHSLNIFPKNNCIINDPNKLKPSQTLIWVPERSERTIKILSSPDVGKPKVCLQKEILPGLFVPNCIVESTNGHYTINIMSTTEKSVSFDPSNIEFHDLDNYDAVTLTTNASCERLKSLESLIQTNHMNSEERDSIISICREFNDIFHLEGDKLTYTDAISHTISLLSNKPIFVKPYRLPENQKPEIRRQIEQMLSSTANPHTIHRF
jgi:hypothetical protein